jgi:hypothetical protein
MEKFWPRILSAFSTLAVGLIAGSVARFAPAPAVKVQPPSGAAEVKVRPAPPPVPEPTPPPAGIMRPHSVSISPYEIKRLIDENNRAAGRRQAAEELDLAEVRTRLMMDGEDTGFNYGVCNGNCEAYILPLELDGEPGREILLRLTAEVTWGYCYLIFKRQFGASADWVLLGHVDKFIRYTDPQEKVVAAGANRWLVLGRTSGYGSGFGSYTNDWYEVGKDGVAPVLSYMTEFYMGGANHLITSRTTKLLSLTESGGVTTVVLSVSTSREGYVAGERDPLHLWSNKRKATFIKGPYMEKFIFDPLRSEIAEKELSPDSGFDDAVAVTNDEFLKYNYRELLKIASEHWTRRKDWLFEFLKSCGDSVEKRSLLDTAVINDKCLF